MKKIFLVTALLTCICAGRASAQSNHAMIDGVSVREWIMEKRGDSLYVELLLSVPRDIGLKRKEVLVFDAFIQGEDHSRLELPSVRATFNRKGKKGDPLLLRVAESDCKWRYDLNVTETLIDQDSSLFSYEAWAPYEEWFKNAWLGFTKGVAECDFVTLSSARLFIPEKPYYKIGPALSFVSAEIIEKTSEISGTVRIAFRLNDYRILPGLKNNKTELDNLNRLVSDVTSQEYVYNTTMTITGYASPDGPYALNETLQYNRARELALFISANSPLPLEQIRFSAVPEDWEGLREAIDKSEMRHRNELLAIIDTVEDMDERERQIKRLAGGSPYRELTAEILPSLRRSEFTIVSVFRDYITFEELRDIYDSPRQSSLSAYEMLLVASLHKTGSTEYAGIINTILEHYPYNEAANINRAALHIGNGEWDAAEPFLLRAGDSGEALNLKGLSETNKGNYKAAREYLEQAHSLGTAEAEHNLGELNKAIEIMGE